MKSMLLLALVPAAMLLIAPTRASAQTIEACQTDVASLTTLTESTVFLGDKGLFFQTKLLFHLSKATDALAAGDARDALHQLRDYQRDLGNATDNAVISAVDAAALQAGADVVIACLQAVLKP